FDHVFVGRLACAGPIIRAAARCRARLVHAGADLLERRAQRFGRAANAVGIAAFQRLTDVFDLALDILARLFRHLVTELAQRLLRREDRAVGAVAQLHLLATLLVFRGVTLGVLDHLVDLGLRQPAAGRDSDLLLASGRLVPSGHVQDTV